ncbi:type IV pilus biogenesis protein PilP [Cupriavidus sp. AU9028]|nr:type IV pilus biogenesis protein PilP [Cupriavidus sp. AU9028]
MGVAAGGQAFAQDPRNPAAAAIAAGQKIDAPTQRAVGKAVETAIPAAEGSGSKAEIAANAAAPSPGEQAAPAGRLTDASELAALQSQHALWKVRAEIAKLKAEVRRSEEGGGAPLPSPSVGFPVSLQASGPMQPAIERATPGRDAPRLLALRAFDGDYNAVLEIGGRAVPVQAGDVLEGGWKVVTIGDDGVKLANGKRVRTLRP